MSLNLFFFFAAWLLVFPSIGCGSKATDANSDSDKVTQEFKSLKESLHRLALQVEKEAQVAKQKLQPKVESNLSKLKTELQDLDEKISKRAQAFKKNHEEDISSVLQGIRSALDSMTKSLED